MRIATLRDVAEQAGVSVSLVSRILNGDPATRAAASTRKRVHRVATAIGYRPNIAARALQSARTDTIGVVAPDLTNALFAEVARGIESRAGELDYTVLLGRAESFYQSGRVARMVEHGRVDGIILQGLDDQSIESVADLVSQAPSVLVHGRIPAHPGSVMIDDAGSAKVATEHLISLGHRRIAFVNGPADLLTAQRREAGYRQAMRDHGLRVQTRLVTHYGYQVGVARHAVQSILASRPLPTAVVVANVNAAFGVLTTFRESGVRVPDDLSVIAIHDSWVCDHTWPPLTTVRTPLYQLGRAAVEQLHRRLAGEDPKDIEVTSPRPDLVDRRSVLPIN